MDLVAGQRRLSIDQLASAAWQNLARAPQNIVVGDPGPELMFDDRVYKRGALTLHALRLALGDRGFFALLQDWTSRYRHSSVTAEEFADLAGRYSSESLRPLWEAWLYQRPLPQLPPVREVRTGLL